MLRVSVHNKQRVFSCDFTFLNGLTFTRLPLTSATGRRRRLAAGASYKVRFTTEPLRPGGNSLCVAQRTQLNISVEGTVRPQVLYLTGEAASRREHSSAATFPP